MRQPESRVFPNIESALPDASEMGCNAVIIRLHYTTSGKNITLQTDCQDDLTTKAAMKNLLQDSWQPCQQPQSIH